MDIDELIARVDSEPERTVTVHVWKPPPEVLRKATQPGGLSLTELAAARGNEGERREVRYRHVLGPPSPAGAIDAWLAQHPAYRLPADLRSVVERTNGIHLWANAESRRAYVGLAPIEEWDVARVRMYGPEADPALLDDRYLAISYDQGGAAFVVLDVASGKYFLMDAAGPDESSLLGTTAGEVLDWLWRTRIEPRNR